MLSPSTVTIDVDFNAATESSLIPLNTRGALTSLVGVVLLVGQEVLLTDGELKVHGVIVEERGGLLARPDWWALEHYYDD